MLQSTLRATLTILTLIAAALIEMAIPDRTAYAAAAQACPASIVSCGCSIASSGYYQVDASLSESQGLTARGECIAVKASNVILNLNASEISGAHASMASSRNAGVAATIGVHILAGSNYDFVEGAGAMIAGWSVGVQVEGSQNDLEYFNAENNDVAGVILARAASNNVTDFIANHNGHYGVWLVQSNNNKINASDADENGDSGVYLGCSAANGAIVGCKQNVTVSGNRLFNLMVNNNGAYGIMLDSGARHSTVADVSAQGNLTADLGDANADCGSNVWFDDSFATVNQYCVDPMLR